MKKFLFIVFSHTLGFFGMAQVTITGTVFDGEFNEPLPFANVLISEKGSGTTTDFDGKFLLEVAPGNYTLVFSFVGYQTQQITNVDCTTNNMVELEVTLQAAAQGLEEVVVSVSASRNTEQSVLTFQKKAASLLDGMSAQAFKKAGASDIAAAIKRVPGVSVQGGKYVYVRGLGDRYTKSTLNGVDIPGLDPDRNTVQMDLFPTNILSNVIVIKSATAELPADFTGAIVDIETKDIPNSKQQSISISGEYNPDMHFNPNYLAYVGGNTDFLGFDDGTRDLPTNASILGQGFDPRFGLTPQNAANISSLTKSFDPTMSATNQTSGMDFSFGYTAANAYDVGNTGNRLGLLAAFSYKNSTDFYEGAQNNIFNKNENEGVLDLESNRTQVGNIGSNNVIVSGLLGISYKTEYSKYKFNFLHVQNGESRSGNFRQETRFSDFIDFNKDNLEYTERSITNLLLSGVHGGEDGTWKTIWKISPSISKSHDKDVRVTAFQDEEGVFSFKENTEPKRIWRLLDEVALVGKIDVSKKYNLFDNNALLKFGGYASYKQRDFSIAQISVSTLFSSPADWLRYNGDPNQLFADNNVWTLENQNGTYINAQTTILQEANKFDAYQLNGAAYISNEFRISPKLRSILGLRLEKFNLYYTGSNSQQGVFFDKELIIDKLNLFPTANLIYELNDNTNLRLAYYKTTARPSFKEASIAEIFDPLSNLVFIGNVDIKPTYIDNVDVRYETYGENAQMFAVSAFYKKFKDPIELSFVAASTSNFTPLNLGDANVYGVEFELRKNLGFINGLDIFDVNINASLIEAFQKYSDDERRLRTNGLRTGETLGNGRALQGQSPYLINAALNLTLSEVNLQGSLGYNVQGKTLEVVGDGFYPDVYTLPFHSLNFNLIKGIGENQTITLKLKNILDQKRESVFESFGAPEEVFSFRNPGRSISLGYSINLD